MLGPKNEIYILKLLFLEHITRKKIAYQEAMEVSHFRKLLMLTMNNFKERSLLVGP